ncbi:ribose-phosphate pyrophosphokinase [Pseudomonas phage phiPsa347]|uniref:Ribose-phosphate pyrophosphokinase n=1 Tax=Pseudomonas phage phiPsa347 TaxID=1460364 RepID=A0A7G9V295_9CAUD|nr:ribose-phosphate pyrophosphokinase [Pseudomonas phage phiPsa347]QNO00401.1 ribose-phosphate pyrophosphokinase [Pseudomonas phage phiPsa347]
MAWNTGFNENLFYTLNGSRSQRVSVSTMTFPGGEVGVNINTGSVDWKQGYMSNVTRIDLVAKIQNSDQLMAMFLATDALRRVYPLAQIDLLIPYFPYARQDRVCNAGEALSVKVIATLINAQNYATVTVLDPHSAVVVGCLDRCFVTDQFDAFGRIKTDWHNWIIVAPDMGAAKKTEDFAKRVGAKNVLQCNKKRNLADGKILGMEVLNPEILSGKVQLLILDDICDGGRTFTEVAHAIFGVVHADDIDRIELAVTHGIFSKGLNDLTMVYDRIYTTDSLPQDELNNEKLTVMKY